MNNKSEIYIDYVDDQRDQELNEYLKIFEKENEAINVKYNFIEYNTEEGYQSLIESEKIKQSDIILLDYKLFTDDTINGNHKIYGNDILIILKSLYPYKKIILIAQSNEELESVIEKYNDQNSFEDPDSYYRSELGKRLEWYCKEIRDIKSTLKQFNNKSDTYDDVIKSIVDLNSDSYSTSKIPSEEDIDNLVELFKEMVKNENS